MANGKHEISINFYVFLENELSITIVEENSAKFIMAFDANTKLLIFY